MSLDLSKSRWKRVALRDVVRHVTDRVDPETSGLTRFLAGEHIPSDNLSITSWGIIGQDPIGPMFYKRFKPGHVLYVSRRTYLRKVAVPEFEGITGEKTFVLETLDPDVLLQELLPFILSAERFHTYAVTNSRGSVNPYLNWGELAAFEFNLPPIDEQRRIANLLWAVQRDSESSAAAVSAVDRLIDTWMRDAGRIAEAEPVVLGTLVEHSIGGVWGADPGASELDVAVIRGTDISIGGEVQVASAPTRSIKLTEARSRTLLSGDVLVEKSGGSPDQPVGKVGLVRVTAGGLVPSNFVLLLRPDLSQCEPVFLFALLRGMWRHGGFAEFTGKTTNIANLRTKELLASMVRVPSLEVQRRLATELDALEQLRTASSSTLEASASLRASLIADSFGGN